MKEVSHISIGRQCEQIAEQYLKNRGFSIIERNYRKKFGEIDIVAKKDNVVHFVEVKGTASAYSRAVQGVDVHRPEEHMHKAKLARLARTIEAYILERQVTDAYTLDLLVICINENKRRVQVRAIWDVSYE